MKLEELIKERITGEWGIEPNGEDTVKVIRTTNFQNDGQLNLNEVVKRKIDRKIIDKKKLRPNDIIIEKSGGSPNQPVGRVVYFENSTEEYLCNNFTTILRPTKEVIPKYLFYNLYYNHIVGKTQRYQNKTTGILNLQLERYLQEEIFIPDETKQKNIVKALDKSFSLIQKRKETIKLADEFLRSTFLEMFGDPIMNTKKWDKDILEKLGNIITGSTPPSNKEGMWGGSIPFITPVDLENGSNTSKRYVTEEGAKNSRVARKGSTLVCCIGATIGKVDVARQESAFNQQINAIEWYDHINDFFGLHLMRFMKPIIIKKGTSTTLPILNKTQFSEISVIVPDKKLQDDFEKIVIKTEQLKDKYQTSLTEMENQFNSLMQRAFRGEL